MTSAGPSPRQRPRTLPQAPSRRDVLRWAGVVGVGSFGLGLHGCSERPDEELVDTITEPKLIQGGGVVTGTVLGLLQGGTASGVVVRFGDEAEVSTDDYGRFEARMANSGDFRVRVRGTGIVPRDSYIRLQGNAEITITVIEKNSGLSVNFLDQFTRGTGPRKEDFVSPNRGKMTRWGRTPEVRIYRRVSDDDKDVLTDARMDAVRQTLTSQFGSLTGNRLGVLPAVSALPGQAPERLSEVPSGTIVIAHRNDGLRRVGQVMSLTNPYEIVKARISCRADSTIGILMHMFGHALGANDVGASDASVMNAGGLAALSEADLASATVLYSRPPGSRSPDRDPDGFFLNA